jgi:putative aldouronate transport system permease protein
MVHRLSLGRRVFLACTYAFLALYALICLLPIVHVLAVSLSGSAAAASGAVGIWPVQLTLKSYQYVVAKVEFVRALLVSVQRVLLGVPVNMLLILLMAYPLSRPKGKLRFRKAYTVFLMITIMFGGGLIPWYMVVKMAGLIDTMWALILPGAVPVFSVILLMNFFRGLPSEIEEAAFIDGASHWQTLWRVCVPLSLPALATLVLFSAVGHWNSWFDGIILMNKVEHYPLQSYLQTIIVKRTLQKATLKDVQEFAAVSDRTNKAAQIFIGALPILVLYPFLQRYFMTGIVLGSVKG